MLRPPDNAQHLSVGARIIWLRKNLYDYLITQTDLASMAGVTKAAISAWELDKTLPRRESLEKLRKRNISPDWIIHGTGDPLLPAQVCGEQETVSLTPAQRGLLESFSALDDAQQRAVWNMIELLSQGDSHPLPTLAPGRQLPRRAKSKDQASG